MISRASLVGIFKADLTLLLSIGLVKMTVHFLGNGHYGYFRDEYYYLACADHLAWGYVDHPPLSILLLKTVRALLGDSLFAIRLPAVLAEAGVVVLAGLIARGLGGARFAQVLSAISAAVVPVFLVSGGFFSMNALDHLFWALAIYVLVLIVKGGDRRLWLLFGGFTGLGLQNKISVLFLGFGVVVGLLLTRERKWFREPYFWLSGLLAFLLFSPYALWQIPNEFATLEFMRNASQLKNLPMSPLQFTGEFLLEAHPFNLPILIAGIVYVFSHPEGKRWRFLGWAFLSIYILFLFQNAKPYYLAPALLFLLAPGSIGLESWFDRRRLGWMKPVVLTLLVLGGALLLPLTLPVLPIEKYLAYQERLGIEPTPAERGHSTEIPQHFADRFGWMELTQRVTEVFENLSPSDRSKSAIFTGNYGEAGALLFHGKSLPPIYSGHNNFYLWGKGKVSGEVWIVMGVSREGLVEIFANVELAALHTHPYAQESRVSIYVCRGLKAPMEELFEKVKSYI
jgi:hypothetical protein